MAAGTGSGAAAAEAADPGAEVLGVAAEEVAVEEAALAGVVPAAVGAAAAGKGVETGEALGGREAARVEAAPGCFDKDTGPCRCPCSSRQIDHTE